MKVGVLMDSSIRLRPDQMIKASEAAKRFGYARKKAKDLPQFITENGNIDSVLMDYEYYLKMYQRLVELEAKEEARVLDERIDRLENDPTQGIPWQSIRRSEQRMREKRFDVRLDPDASKEYNKLDNSVLPEVNKAIDELEYRAILKRSKKWDVGKRQEESPQFCSIIK